MSGFEQFQRLIYWNKVTNTEYLNNMIHSYDRLYKEFQTEKVKKDKLEQIKLKKKHAEDVYNSVSQQIIKKYPQWASQLLSNKDNQIEVISNQLTFISNKEQLQNKILQKVLTLIKTIESNNELKMFQSMLYTSDICLSKQQIRANDNILVKNWINMFNLFLTQGYYNLLTQQKFPQDNKKQQGYIYISYYKNLDQSNHKRMGISFFPKNINSQLLSFYLYKINDKDKPCCQQAYNQKWLYQMANENEDSHSIDKFLFVIYLANIDKLCNYQGVFQSNTEQSLYHWKMFQKKLPGILGYLLNNNLYEAYAYLNQSRFLR